MDYLKNIRESQIESIEDGARLLSQASIGEGTIYVCGINEMAAVSQKQRDLSHLATAAFHPDESLELIGIWIGFYSLLDIPLIQALQLAKKLTEQENSLCRYFNSYRRRSIEPRRISGCPY